MRWPDGDVAFRPNSELEFLRADAEERERVRLRSESDIGGGEKSCISGVLGGLEGGDMW